MTEEQKKEIRDKIMPFIEAERNRVEPVVIADTIIIESKAGVLSLKQGIEDVAEAFGKEINKTVFDKNKFESKPFMLQTFSINGIMVSQDNEIKIEVKPNV